MTDEKLAPEPKARIAITEEMDVHKDWYKQAKEQTRETLTDFIDHLSNDYEHDYGTICHALTAGAIATAWVINRGPQGGITGFQAGAVMWEFIRNWNHVEGPLRLVDYKNMLYPQYEDDFQKTMSKDAWEYLQKKAKEGLADTGGTPNVRMHWQSIVDGIVPFGYKIED